MNDLIHLLRYGQVSFTLPNLVNGVTSRLNTKFALSKLESFLEKNKELGVAAMAFNEAKENIIRNVRWMDVQQKRVLEWLRTNCC
jgi:peptide subunit release factor 1 (eRF1)